MRVECKQEILLEAVDDVRRVVNPAAAKEQYRFAKFTASDSGRCTLTASDGETTIQTTLPEASIERFGTVMLPYAKFCDVIRLAAKDAPVVLDGDAGSIQVSQGKNRFSLLTVASFRMEHVLLRHSDFHFEIASDEFLSLVNKVSFAVDDNSLRVAGDSVLVKSEGGVLTLVATDLRRMALTASQVESPRDFAYIVREGVLKIAALSAPKKAMLEVGFASDRHLRVVADGFVFQSLLVEGKFPPYEKITQRLPDAKLRDTATVSAPELHAACRQALLCYPDGSPTNAVRWIFSPGKITIQTVLDDKKHSGSIDVPATYSGPRREVCVDPNFIAAALQKGFDDKKQVRVDYCGERMPLIIRGKSFRYILMPIVPPSGR